MHRAILLLSLEHLRRVILPVKLFLLIITLYDGEHALADVLSYSLSHFARLLNV